MFTIVSGPKGSGKSTYLLQIAETYRLKGIPVGGVISRGFWKNGEREHYEAVNPATGESILLAVKTPPPGIENEYLFCHGKWFFLRSAFDEGNCRIRQFVDAYANIDIAGESGEQAALFIDEIGEIELSGGGWEIANIVNRIPPAINVFLGVRQSILPRLEEIAGAYLPDKNPNPRSNCLFHGEAAAVNGTTKK